MADNKKYYWLKLNQNFFEREEVKVLEGMENGEQYINFYLKLLLKSIATEGKLLFRNIIPYTPEMLATITNTNVDTVMVATKLFLDFGLMQKLDDGTLFMSEIQNMIGCETKWAKKKREYREKLEATKDNVPALSESNPSTVRQEKDKEIELEKELDIDKEKDKDKDKDEDIDIDKDIENIPQKRKRFTPPTVNEVTSYCKERNNNVDAQRFVDYYISNGWLVGKNKMKDWQAAVRTWERNSKDTSIGYSASINTYKEKDIASGYDLSFINRI